MKKIILVLVFGILAMAAFGQGKVLSSNPDIQKGVELHDSARGGEFSNVQKAIDLLKPYIKSDAVACAYYGSALTLCAAECAEDNPIKSLDFLEQGGKFLDDAVKMEPANPAIKLIRLENGIEVSRSSPVKRYSVISEDVDFLMDSDLSDWGKAEKAEAYLYCGLYMLDAGSLDDAFDLFDSAVEAAPGSAAAKEAQKMIDKYSE